MTAEPRRAPAAPKRPTTKRKFSTERHQRQAEQALANEEGRPNRPPVVREESVDDTFLKDFFTKERSAGITSLSRADTGLSPLDIHPGHRVRGFSIADKLLGKEKSNIDFVKPFAEPEETKFTAIKHEPHPEPQPAVDVESAQSRIQRAASDARESNVNMRYWYNKVKGRRAVKPGVFQGIQYASSFATAHANAILLHQPAAIYDRQALYALEFDLDTSGALICAPPQSFDRTSDLREYLNESSSESALRIIYTCNNEEAINYLSQAFGISDPSREGTDRSFRDWMQNDRVSRGAGNKAIRWRPSYDVARDVICTAFGLDFGSIILSGQTTKSGNRKAGTSSLREKPSKSSPPSQSVLHRQRLLFYMQRGLTSTIPGARVTCFNTGSRNLQDFARRNTMIISEYSSGEVGEIVNIPSLLSLDPGYLYSSQMSASDAILAAMESTLIHVLGRVLQIWQDQLSLIHEKHAELEDHIYERPADDSRAGDVWAMSQHIHDILKLVNRHAKVIQVIQEDFKSFSERAEEQEWLDQTIEDFGHLSHDLHADYIEPLENMIDLMYKSVTIRDSHQSLELSAALWRLSWITFIFLPLTFLVGFFGMNVTTFQHYPPVRWYFISTIVLMAVVLAAWLAFRKFMPSSHPSQSIRYSSVDLLRLRNVANLSSRGRESL